MKKFMVKKFLWWMNERQNIYLNKKAGEPWPWTKDKILQEYKFTNVFRQQDKVTIQLSKRIVECKKLKLCTPDELLFRIAVFRMFNWPYTYDLLHEKGLLFNWNKSKAIRTVQKFQSDGNKIFTGAYMMTGSGASGPGGKVVTACNTLNSIYKDRKDLIELITRHNSIEMSTLVFAYYPLIGNFVGYEISTDLRHTPILNKAKDIMTWANPGPGAKRGLNRIYGRELKFNQKTELFIKEMQELLKIVKEELEGSVLFKNNKFEMRDVEHSLCEFDKYTRVKNEEGRPRSRYTRQQ